MKVEEVLFHRRRMEAGPWKIEVVVEVFLEQGDVQMVTVFRSELPWGS
jgi:hypothetical protein